MENLSLINNKVTHILKEENNQVVYTAWLSYTEDAKFENNNIVINVPNQYIKESLEERYLSGIEALYRNELSFSKVIVKTDAEQVFDTFNKAETVEYVNASVLNAVEKIMLSSKQFTVSL